MSHWQNTNFREYEIIPALSTLFPFLPDFFAYDTSVSWNAINYHPFLPAKSVRTTINVTETVNLSNLPF